ncbi:endoplasmic reticulum resident protein 44 isoform X2 [Neocloeon triangulifer]|uniref:endoplasmic reticulum resident protein 44 isoform X2 n=1 Tax=Neocloeon triangulifer TaxID=2078957 RepID=UPI00286F559C|nr:endoplasmic reticulum resident protein 44 isoform X2 [Neocloeon triangulifer]
MDHKLLLLFSIFTFVLFYNPTNSNAVQLNTLNIDSILATNELVMVNFYADWCRFSNLLAPIWDEAATLIAKSFPIPGKVVLAKVDCDAEGGIATRYHITKYPTLKIFRNGQVTKKEYRGQRSAEAMLAFVKKQMEDPVKEFKTGDKIEPAARAVIGVFASRLTPEYDTYRKAATSLKDDCSFYFKVEALDHNLEAKGDVPPPSIEFVSNNEHIPYSGDFTMSAMTQFLQPLCIPLVREITFENAEELSEEGLPFLILFHRPSDSKSKQEFSNLVNRELREEKQNVNFLTADGEKFSHPLHHLGKSDKDLPLLAIDSFRHMYLFPKYEDSLVPGKVLQFLKDLYSGKLHREFHYGPDATQQAAIDGSNSQPVIITAPPESTFKKLAPSRNRYTLLRDEL